MSLSFFSKPLIGLDIGVSGIKALEIKAGKKPTLISYNRVPLPANTISPEGEIVDSSNLVLGLKKLINKKFFTSNKVAFGAFSGHILTKKITVPKMSEEELTNQLFFEAEQYIPFAVSDVNIDFIILGQSPATAATTTPMMDVLIIAAKKDSLSSFRNTIADAGVEVGLIDSPMFALGNVFELAYGSLSDKHPSVLIDFGASATKISVIEKRNTVFTRDLRQSGNSCTEMLAERLGVSFEQAETMKLQGADTPTLKPVLKDFIDNLCEEISKAVDFWCSQSNQSIQCIYYCGGGSLLTGLIEHLANSVNYPITALNPLSCLKISKKHFPNRMLEEIKVMGVLSMGLALRLTGDVKG